MGSGRGHGSSWRRRMQTLLPGRPPRESPQPTVRSRSATSEQSVWRLHLDCMTSTHAAGPVSPATNADSSAASSNRLLTLPEVCERLGVSRSTFYDWRQARKAPPCLILPNTQIRVRESDLDGWVASRMDLR